MIVYNPPKVVVKLQGRTFKKAVAEGELISFDKLPGEAVGTAVVRYSQISADDFDPQMGKLADIYVGGTKVFAGYVIDAPAEIDPDTDVSTLVIADVKGLLRGRFIGEKGIGDQADPDKGFLQVGFDIVFNRDGFGDKAVAGLTWGRDTSWTCAHIMLWIFTHYVPTTIATLDAEDLWSEGWTRSPANLDLAGATVLSAIDQVAKLAGESWDLRPAKGAIELVDGDIDAGPTPQTACTYARIGTGTGDVKTVRLFRPGREDDATSANIYHAVGVQIRPSVQGTFEWFEAHSAGGVVETMFGTDTARSTSLKAETTISDAKFVKRYSLDVTKYEARKAGCNLATGSRPKPMMPWLVTRVDRTGAILNPPYSEDAERLKGPIVWMLDKTDFNAAPCRVDDGYAIDLDWATIEFERKLTLVDGYGVKSDIEVDNWANVDVYLTAAVRVEERQIEVSEYNESLPETQKALINRMDLVPEWRWKSAVPAKSSAGWQILSNVAERVICVDQTEMLQAAALNANINSFSVQRAATIRFRTVPAILPGDRVIIRGRTLPDGNTGLSVTDVRMDCIDGVPGDVVVQATNATIAINPEDYLSSKRTRQ